MFGIPIALIYGALSGFGINAVAALASPAGRIAFQLLPMAVRLAHKVARGHDASADAEALLKMAPNKVVRAETPTEGVNDGESDSPPAATKAARKR